jgi:hypothetical protein
MRPLQTYYPALRYHHLSMRDAEHAQI